MHAPVLISRAEIKDELWNQLIERSAQRNIYAYSWYLDCVSPGWSALVWPSTTRYDVVMPLPIVRKWGLAMVRQPFFCQFLGIYAENELLSPVLERFIEKLTDCFPYISRYCFHPQNTGVLTQTLSSFPELISKSSATYHLYLPSSYDQLYKTYSLDKKQNLKRADRYQWDVIESDSPEIMIRLFIENHASGIPGGVSPQSYRILNAVWAELKRRNLATMYYAVSPERIAHAGCLIVREGLTHTYLFNAADSTGRKGNARSWILNQFFRTHCDGKQIFDFESPEIESIIANYTGFSPQKVDFVTVRKNKLPPPFRQWQEWRIRKQPIKK